MKAFVLDRYRKKGQLALADVATPPVGDHDVLVEIHAAGVNLVDAKIRDGEFTLVLPYKIPLILGNDVAGRSKSPADKHLLELAPTDVYRSVYRWAENAYCGRETYTNRCTTGSGD